MVVVRYLFSRFLSVRYGASVGFGFVGGSARIIGRYLSSRWQYGASALPVVLVGISARDLMRWQYSSIRSAREQSSTGLQVSVGY
jgi:hypothetical protein